MIKIKSLKDIQKIEKYNRFPRELLQMLENEIAMLKEWFDIDDEYTIETFNTDNFDYGYIVILEGNETNEDFAELGVPPNFRNIIPEDIIDYVFESSVWSRMIIIYNDSYSMSFWTESEYLKSMISY